MNSSYSIRSYINFLTSSIKYHRFIINMLSHIWSCNKIDSCNLFKLLQPVQNMSISTNLWLPSVSQAKVLNKTSIGTFAHKIPQEGVVLVLKLDILVHPNKKLIKCIS